jgi:threonine dehydrogenase-like Zn-dependent dehydrogenase
MTDKILAAVKVAPERTELREFDRPSIPADAGLLRVEAAGVGGSDPEFYRSPKAIPAVMGHENVGRIEAMGEFAAARWGLVRGDRVALQEYLPCWQCKWCRQGEYRLCPQSDFFNAVKPKRFGQMESTEPPHLWGGYAQFMYLPNNIVFHRFPDHVPSYLATLAVPLGNGWQWAVIDGGVAPGRSVLVFGPGQQGLGCIIAAKLAGASQVILAGMGSRDGARMALAPRLGADIVIDVEKEDLKDRVRALTGGDGVDVVVDTTGDPTGQIVADSIAVAAKGAQLNLNGLEQSVPLMAMKKFAFTVRTPRGRSYRAVELALRVIASGRLPLAEMCSHRFALADTHKAIMATAGREIADAIHVTVEPWS